MNPPARVLWDGQVPVGDGGTRRHRVILLRTNPGAVAVEAMRTDALGGESWYPVGIDSLPYGHALVSVINDLLTTQSKIDTSIRTTPIKSNLPSGKKAAT